MNNSKMMISFVVGAAIGAAIVYLTTSEEGQEIMADLKEKSKTFKDGFGEQFDKGKNILRDLKETASGILNTEYADANGQQ